MAMNTTLKKKRRAHSTSMQLGPVVSCCLGSSRRETEGLAWKTPGLTREAQGLAREDLWQRLATGLQLVCNILQQTCGDIYDSILLHVHYIMPVWQYTNFYSAACALISSSVTIYMFLFCCMYNVHI